MSFEPKDFYLGDTWQCSDGENVHCFYLQNREHDSRTDLIGGSIGHAVSKDMMHWTELPPALYRDGGSEDQELDLWTGCTVIDNGIWYLFYTSRRRSNVLANSICVATSTDGITWEKYEGNPVIEPDGRYYYNMENDVKLAVHSNNEEAYKLVDCRDLCVVWDEEQQVWWGYFAVRRPGDECTETSVIGLARSEDLLHWEQLPPCFCPNKYGCIETPEVFCINGKWYMLCLSGNDYGQRNRTGDPNMIGRITVYAVADKPEGPYHECFEDSVILGSMEASGICSRTVLHNDKRYFFYSQTLTYADPSKRALLTLSLPKEVLQNEDGSLSLGWYEGIDTLCRENGVLLSKEHVLVDNGRWGSRCKWSYNEDTICVEPKHDWCVQMFDVEGGNYVLETTIKRGDCIAAGFIFDVVGNDIYSSNRVAMIDFEEEEVWLTQARNFKKVNARKTKLQGDTYHFKLLCLGDTIEIYVNEELKVHHQCERTGGKIGLLADMGKVQFKETKIRFIDETL